MSARTIIITGASDGIGAAAARQLHEQGENVVIVGRSADKTKAVGEALGVPSYVADFSELDQVRELGGKLLEAYPRIDVLANNAGGIMGAREVTGDGCEKTFQVNHLAPFLLTQLLLPTLLASKAAVIQTSSIAARKFGNIDIDDLQNEKKYSPNKAYGDAKLENILFTRELHRRYHDQGLSAVAFHPGVVATNFAAETTSVFRFVYNTPLRRFLTPVDVGGSALTWLAAGVPGESWAPGGYYERNQLAPAEKMSHQTPDEGLARELWERSWVLAGL